MQRTMFTQLTRSDADIRETSGVLFTQVGEGDLPDSQFWVSREEAPDVIRMLADALDIDIDLEGLP